MLSRILVETFGRFENRPTVFEKDRMACDIYYSIIRDILLKLVEFEH